MKHYIYILAIISCLASCTPHSKHWETLMQVESFIEERPDSAFWEYGGKKEIYKKLEVYPALYKTVKEFEETIKNMHSNDSYAADRFRKAYEQNLRDSATARIDTLLGLKVSGNTQALGAAALPYET